MLISDLTDLRGPSEKLGFVEIKANKSILIISFFHTLDFSPDLPLQKIVR